MRSVEELRNDHGNIRAKLSLLERLLRIGQNPHIPLTEVIDSILRILRCHIEKEEYLITILKTRFPLTEPQELTLQIQDEHQVYLKTLAVVSNILCSSSEDFLEQMSSYSTDLIAGLREHMAIEEAKLFVQLDLSLGPKLDSEAERFIQGINKRYLTEEVFSNRKPHQNISEDMSVNHILRVHPYAKEIFKAFNIDVDTDGFRCIDELFWERGLDVEGILLCLNQAADDKNTAAPFSELVWGSCDGFMVIDESRRILAMNDAMEKIMGHRMQDVVGKCTCPSILSCQDRHGCAMSGNPKACPGLKAMRRVKPVRFAEMLIRSADGKRKMISASYTPIRSNPKGPVWALAVMRDSSLVKRREREIRRCGSSDAMTGLLNMENFMEALKREVSRSNRYHKIFSIAEIDIDDFSYFDEAFGHTVSEEILKRVASLLNSSHRKMEVVARGQKDEFFMLLPEASAEKAVAACNRLRKKLLDNVKAILPDSAGLFSSRLDGASGMPSARFSVSIGVAAFPEDGTRADELMAKVDHRVFEAKLKGGDCIEAPAEVSERRRCQRLDVETPILIKGRFAGDKAGWQQAQLKNISESGAYVVALRPSWMKLREEVSFTVSIPQDKQADFPFSKIAGSARVVRIDNVASKGSASRVGIALSFTEEVSALSASSGNGHDNVVDFEQGEKY